jgi:hypothetical protein
VAAAKAFFKKAIKNQGQPPKTITLDGYAASHRAVREMKADGLLPADTEVRSSKYLNNLIEQDHRNIKSRTTVMLGFKRFRGACDHDFRHRVDASHSQGAVQSRDARPQRHHYADRLECGPVGSISHPIKINFLDYFRYLHQSRVFHDAFHREARAMSGNFAVPWWNSLCPAERRKHAASHFEAADQLPPPGEGQSRLQDLCSSRRCVWERLDRPDVRVL